MKRCIRVELVDDVVIESVAFGVTNDMAVDEGSPDDISDDDTGRMQLQLYT